MYRTRKMVMPGNLNGANTLFGGQALAWIDEEAAIFAVCQMGTSRIVTKAMSKVDFKAPARLGDIIEIGCDIVRVGTTSMTVSCTMRNKTTQQEILTVDEIVFVSLGEDGRPTPHKASITKAE
jgi:acyl-CoA thioesterase YciA